LTNSYIVLYNYIGGENMVYTIKEVAEILKVHPENDKNADLQ
jgi:hypothetical protein